MKAEQIRQEKIFAFVEKNVAIILAGYRANGSRPTHKYYYDDAVNDALELGKRLYPPSEKVKK